MTIYIRPHRGPRRSGDLIPGLHIHNQTERDGGIHSGSDEDDGHHLHDPTLEEHHYPKGRLYTPEIDRLRDNLERRTQGMGLGQEGSAPESPIIVEEDGKELEGNTPDIHDKVSCGELDKERCFNCESREFPVDLDLEHQRMLFFKIMFLRSFHFLAAFGLTFYVQLSWEITQVVKKPMLVQFAFDYPWILFIALSLYGIVYATVRFTYIGRNRCSAFHIFILKTLSLMICTYISGVRWQLILVSTITLTLGINSILLAFLPLFNEDIEVSKRGGLLQMLSFLDNLLLAVGVWFMVSGMLSNAPSFLSLPIAHENIYSQLFLYAFPTFIIAEVITALDLIELRRILNGRRFPVHRKSCLRAVITLP